MRVRCLDGKTRICRIPGRLTRRLWVRESDIVVVEPWEFGGDEKGDIIYKYTPTQLSFLRRKGYLKQLDDFEVHGRQARPLHGVLTRAQQQTLYDGYAFLRRTDHALRLLFDRPKEVLPANRLHLWDLARLLGYASVEQFTEDYQCHTTSLRRVYKEIVVGGQ